MADPRRGRHPPVIIVGGGVGGLATAIRLRVAGHPVTVLEKNEVVGGKLAVYRRDGHVFDVGPSVLTLPYLLDDLFREAGTTLREQVDLVRLDPQFRYHWRGGADLDVPDDPGATAESFERFSPGAGDEWRSFDAHGRRIWDVAVRTFFAGPMSNPVDLARRIRSTRDLIDIDGRRTLAQSADAHFSDPRLRQWAGRYATYSGSSPFRAPATLGCIPHVESRFGIWHPLGGLSALRDAFVTICTHVGVEIRTNSDVTDVRADRRRVSGVQLRGGERLSAPIVVANADAEHLYADLLPDDRALRRVRRAHRSMSGLVICVATTGRSPAVGHHNVWFSGDARHEFDQLERGELPDDPTIYACVSSVTDPSQAPDGEQNWLLLVNTPAGVEIDDHRHADLVLGCLADHGTDLRSRISFRHTIGPGDFARRFRSPGGAIYGSSSNGRRAAFVRPANRGAREGLYLVGGSSHPGGGLPLVTISARIVAEMIADDVR